jgi:hypothetical protein
MFEKSYQPGSILSQPVGKSSLPAQALLHLLAAQLAQGVARDPAGG